MCSKETAYSSETLEETKNCYMKEEDTWRQFSAEMNNNYIEEEIILIRALTNLIPSRYKI